VHIVKIGLQDQTSMHYNRHLTDVQNILLHVWVIAETCRRSFSCIVDRKSRYNRVKNNQLDAQLILSIFRQPLYVSGVCRLIIRRYNRMYTTIGIYCFFFLDDCLLFWLDRNCSNSSRTTDTHLKNNKYQMLYTFDFTS
jgi:hypothetical protein